MKKPIVLSLSLALGTLGFAQGPATVSGSLFNDSANSGLLMRRTARKKGDVLTIRVNEVMKGQYSATTSTSKTEAAAANKISIPILDVFAGPVLGNILGRQAGTPQKIINGLLGGGNTGGTQSSTGTGTSTTNSQFSTNLTVIVTEVDSAGNLHIEGFRNVQVNKEVQKITLTGIVRPDDIAPDNSVASEAIANAEIKADGKGAVAEKTRKSLLSKILDWLF